MTKIKFISNRMQKLKHEKNIMLVCSSVLGVATVMLVISSNILASGIGLTTLISYNHYDKAKTEYKKYMKKLGGK